MKSNIKQSLITAVILIAALALANCQSTTYSVKGDGLDWQANPIQVLGTDRVTPIFNVPLPAQLGGGNVPVPIIIPQNTK